MYFSFKQKRTRKNCQIQSFHRVNFLAIFHCDVYSIGGLVEILGTVNINKYSNLNESFIYCPL